MICLDLLKLKEKNMVTYIFPKMKCLDLLKYHRAFQKYLVSVLI